VNAIDILGLARNIHSVGDGTLIANRLDDAALKIVHVLPTLQDLVSSEVGQFLQFQSPFKIKDGKYPINIEETKDTLNLHTADLSALSFVLCHDKEAIILMAPLNFCWKRMAITKELMHIYLLKSLNKRTQYKSVNEIVIAAYNSRTPTPINKTDEIDDEKGCFLLAFEVLVPWGPLRDEYNSMHQSRNCDSKKIAERFKIPENIVRWSIDLGWLKTSNEWNRSL